MAYQFSGPPIAAKPNLLCESPDNGIQFPGKVVLADRGDCTFDTKSVYASVNRARAVVILSKSIYSFIIYNIKYTVL